jgi:hypothetical protein
MQLAGAAPAEPAASFAIPAYAFDRGNAKTFTSQYADAGPMVAFGGDYPVVVEYDIDFPVGAAYTLNIRYATAAARPVGLYLDEKSLGACCRAATGSWNTSGARWEATVLPWFAPGKHTLKLKRNGAFPHVVSLRFDSPEPFPEGWKLDRPKARTLESPPPVPKAERYAPGSVDPASISIGWTHCSGSSRSCPRPPTTSEKRSTRRWCRCVARPCWPIRS